MMDITKVNRWIISLTIVTIFLIIPSIAMCLLNYTDVG
jgi:hypothetical protein